MEIFWAATNLSLFCFHSLIIMSKIQIYEKTLNATKLSF